MPYFREGQLIPGSIGDFLNRRLYDHITEEQRARIVQTEDRLRNAIANLPVVPNAPSYTVLLNDAGIERIGAYLHEQGLLPVDISVIDVRVNTFREKPHKGPGVTRRGARVRIDLEFPEIQGAELNDRPVEEPAIGICFADSDDGPRVACSEASFQFYSWDDHPNVALKQRAEERMAGLIDKFSGIGKTDILLGVVNVISEQVEQGNAERGIKPYRDEPRYRERIRTLGRINEVKVAALRAQLEDR